MCEARTFHFNLVIYAAGEDTKVNILTSGEHPEMKGISVQEAVKYIEDLQTASSNLIGISSENLLLDTDPILLAIIRHPSAMVSYFHRPDRSCQPPPEAVAVRRAEHGADDQLPARAQSKAE